MPDPLPTTPDPWQRLSHWTTARIALGRAGGSLPTQPWLDFAAAHARARDAVHAPLDVSALLADLWTIVTEVISVASAAPTRSAYLQRPDLGRTLPPNAQEGLADAGERGGPVDLAIIVADGLSAIAAQRQAVPVLRTLLPLLDTDGWRRAPIVVVQQGRVAIQDEIGSLLRAQLSLILLGERPGLGSPDSLGAYLIFNPAPGRTDADRNCVSNIRPEGLAPELAARTLHYLLTEARHRKISGVALKDERPVISEPSQPSRLPGTDSAPA